MSAIKNFELKTAAGLYDGVEDICNALDVISDSITECTSTGDVQELKDIIAKLKAYTADEFISHVEYDLAWYSISLTKNIIDATSQYNSAEYE